MNRAQLARVHSVECHHQGMRVSYRDRERCDQSQNVGDMTLSTAKGTLHSPRNVHKPRSLENLCDGGLRARSLEQSSEQESRCCLLSADGRVALSAEQVHRKPGTEDLQVGKDTKHDSTSSSPRRSGSRTRQTSTFEVRKLMRELRGHEQVAEYSDGSEPRWIRLTCTGNSGSTQGNAEVERSSYYELTKAR